MMPEMSMWRSVLTISEEELRNQTSKNTATRDSTSADLSGHFHGSCDSVSPFEKEPGAAPKEWVNERGTRLCDLAEMTRYSCIDKSPPGCAEYQSSEKTTAWGSVRPPLRF